MAVLESKIISDFGERYPAGWCKTCGKPVYVNTNEHVVCYKCQKISVMGSLGEEFVETSAFTAHMAKGLKEYSDTIDRAWEKHHRDRD